MDSITDEQTSVITYASRSSLPRTIEVLADGWTFLILKAAFFGVRRFEEYRRVTGAPRARISERLAHLVLHNVLQKQKYLDRPARYEYILSESGHDLYGMILLMKNWGESWRDLSSITALTHKICGRNLVPILICGNCKNPIRREDIDLEEEVNSENRSALPVRRQLKQKAYATTQSDDPVAKTLSVVADHWTMLVLAEIFNGSTTFEVLRRKIGIAKSTLTSRLNHLIDQAVLEKSLYQEKPNRYRYLLTNSGRDLFGIAITMNAWGEKWLVDKTSVHSKLSHKVCGEVLNPIVVCKTCNKQIFSQDVLRGS